MDMDISSDSSSSDEDTDIGAYWTPMLVCPSQTVCYQMRIFDNFRLGAFFIDILYFNRVLSIYLGNTACLHVKHAYFSASL